MASPFTPSPHGSCFTPSSVWSYTESNIQGPTISSLRVFCWPSVAGKKSNSEAEECHSGYRKCGTLVHCVDLLTVRFSVFVCRLTTGFGISQAPGTSVSRGVRRNALVKASERHGKQRPILRGVKFAHAPE